MTVSRFVRSYMYPDSNIKCYINNEKVDFIKALNCYDEIKRVVFDDFDEGDAYIKFNNVFIYAEKE